MKMLPVVYGIECLPEDSRPEDFFDDKRHAKWARDQMRRGNEWGWCMVRVTATTQHPNGYDVIVGKDYLSGCSYRSQEDFMQPGGYYEDMKKAALDDMLGKFQAAGGVVLNTDL